MSERQVSDCPRGKQKPEPSCTNRHQCWESCGELGKSEEHVRVGREETHKAGVATVQAPSMVRIMEAVDRYRDRPTPTSRAALRTVIQRVLDAANHAHGSNPS